MSGMYRGLIRSFILLILVAVSAVLTYQVWSYEPEFSEIDTTLEGTNNVGQNERVSFEEVMSTYQMVRVSGEEIKGTTNPEVLIGVREELAGSNLTDMNIYNTTNHLSVRGEETGEEEFLIIDYFSDMPSKSLFYMLGLNHDSTIPDFDFDRIVVDIKEDNVIFNLLDESRSRVAIVETDIDAGFLKGLVDEHIDSFEAYTGIITNQNTSSNMTSIYGPSSPGTMKVENFMLSQINTDVINSIMFMDTPNESKQSEDVSIFESENHIATFNPETFEYSYTNLNEATQATDDSHRTLQDIYYFLNSHNGLSQNNILFDFNAEDSSATFRTTLKGRVIFSNSIASQTTVKYGSNSVYEYNRPLIRTNAKVSDGKDVELLDIENVRYQIALDDQLDLQKVSKIVLGYEMTYADDDTDFEFIDYTPQWYVKYDGVWMKFNKGGLS